VSASCCCCRHSGVDIKHKNVLCPAGNTQQSAQRERTCCLSNVLGTGLPFVQLTKVLVIELKICCATQDGRCNVQAAQRRDC